MRRRPEYGGSRSFGLGVQKEHFRDFASPTMAHPRCRELYKRAGSLRLAELFRPILFLLLPVSYSFLKLEGSGVRVSAGSTLCRWLRK